MKTLWITEEQLNYALEFIENINVMNSDVIQVPLKKFRDKVIVTENRRVLCRYQTCFLTFRRVRQGSEEFELETSIQLTSEWLARQMQTEN